MQYWTEIWNTVGFFFFFSSNLCKGDTATIEQKYALLEMQLSHPYCVPSAVKFPFKYNTERDNTQRNKNP